MMFNMRWQQAHDLGITYFQRAGVTGRQRLWVVSDVLGRAPQPHSPAAADLYGGRRRRL
jgi:hypothetical protein